MNNRGVPGVQRYLGQQQNIIRHVVMNRLPVSVSAPAHTTAPAPVAQYPVRQPIYTYQPPAAQSMVSLVQPVPRPRVYQQPLPEQTPQYITSPPPSVTVGGPDAEYFQYSDPIIDNFQYNQNQVLLDTTVDNNNYAMEYHQQHSYQQVQQVQQVKQVHQVQQHQFPQVQNVRYQRIQQSGQQQQVVIDQPWQQMILGQSKNQAGTSASVTDATGQQV